MSEINNLYKKYPYFHAGRFYNYKGEKKPGFLFASIYMMLKSHFHRSYEYPDISSWVGFSEPILRSSELNITWIGHATFLIQIGNINILTDPIFNNLTPFFPRIVPAGIKLSNLPPIDFVIISHNHRDHMDEYAIKEIKKYNPGVTFLVPKGDKAWFDKRKIDPVIECTWWEAQSFTLNLGNLTKIEFNFLPALHWSQRGLFDFNKSLWGSWLINCNGKKIYFAGDTAYWAHFKNIGAQFGPIDIALMPIGPCEPRKWMSHSHVSAEEAGQAFIDLKAKHFIPMHWGTYLLGTDNFLLPLQRICAWWVNQKLDSSKQLHTLKIGQRITFAADDLSSQPFMSQIKPIQPTL